MRAFPYLGGASHVLATSGREPGTSLRGYQAIGSRAHPFGLLHFLSSMRDVHAPPSRAVYRFALGFIFVALAALLLVPLWVGREAEALRSHLSHVIEPAQALLFATHSTILQESSSVRALMVRKDSTFIRVYADARSLENQRFEHLHALVQSHPDLRARVETLRADLGAWHVGHDLFLQGQVPESQYLALLDRQEFLLDRVNARINEIDLNLRLHSDRAHQELHDLTQKNVRVVVALVGVALLAALAIMWFAWVQSRLIRTLRERNREFAALHEMSRALTRALSVEEVSHRIAHNARTFANAGAAFVAQHDAASNTLRVLATEGSLSPMVGAQVQVAGSEFALALENGTSRVVPLNPQSMGSLRLWGERVPAGSHLVILPLLAEGTPLGVLGLVHGSRSRFLSATELDYTLADLAALAMRKSLVLQESEGRRREAERLSVELRQAMESRANLMRGLSHDIKNPLGAAYGYAELLGDGVLGELTEEQQRSAEHIQRTIRYAIDLIQDLLDFARADAGHLETHEVPLDAQEILAELVNDHGAEAQAAGLSWSVTIPTDLPEITTDEMRLRQIVGNLLSNAVKYTPEHGAVRVRAYVSPDNEVLGTGPWFCVEVRDTGEGIPEALREVIFEEFSRLDSEKLTRGSGIGLAISRRIARILGGDIQVDSEPGQGSTFTLLLPLHSSQSLVGSV